MGRRTRSNRCPSGPLPNVRDRARPGAGARSVRGRHLTFREHLLARLYGSRAAALAARLDLLIDAHRRATDGSQRWSVNDAWMIAYPDQFGGEVPLCSLGRVLDALAPQLNGVHVLPFHPSSGDGGFSVEDHALVDPALGDWSDIERLGDRHRLMADAVVNHVSARGAWFQSFLDADPAWQEFFRRVPSGTDLSAVVRPRPGPPTTTAMHQTEGLIDVWATFSADQIDLDFRCPEVLLAVFEAVFRHVDHGAAALRLDAVAYLWKDPEGPSINLSETHTIVALLRSCLDEIDPSVVLITETNVEHADNMAYLGSSALPEAHAVYQFSLPPLVLHAMLAADVEPLVQWSDELRWHDDTTVLNFLACHDGIGLRPSKGWLTEAQVDALADVCEAAGGVVNTAALGDDSEKYELATTWWSLCGHGVTEAIALGRHLATHALLLAVRGVPLLYVHSLVGSENDGSAFDRGGVGRDLNRARFADAAAFVAALNHDEGRAAAVWSELSTMLGWRRSHRAFHPESPQSVRAGGPGVVLVERGLRGEPQALVVVNFGPRSASVDLPSDRAWFRMDGGAAVTAALAVPALTAVWLESSAVSDI